MATFSQNTRHDLSLLPNAPELGDVPQAGRLMGLPPHHDTFSQGRRSVRHEAGNPWATILGRPTGGASSARSSSARRF